MTKKLAKNVRRKGLTCAKALKAKRYDAEDSRERLLKAALEVFSDEGYDAATTREVAKRAGINVSLIQRYFDGKLGLLISLLRKFMEDCHVIPPYQAGATVEAELESYFRMRLTLPSELTKFIKILAMRTIVDPIFRAELKTFTSVVDPVLSLRLRELQSSGKIRPDVNLAEAEKLINVTAHSLLNGAFINEMLAPEEVESLILTAAKILARGLA